ncbi:MAG: 30S ribosomal protein S15 [Elusimicrobia bacterium]|nr:30S ribosomal protein S15 [Elusimicrobiota bacterium]
MITKEKKAEVVSKYQKHPKDTGHSSVQVALLTEKIASVSEHLKGNRKDYTSQVGLLKMVGTRRSLLAYLKKTDPQEYDKVIKQLDLRK